MRSRPNVNPFYIEPTHEDVWEDDWDVPDEYEMEEEVNLIRPREPAKPRVPWTKRPRKARFTSQNGGNRRTCFCMIVLVVILLALLLSVITVDTSSSSSTTQASNHQNITHDTATTPPQPTSQPTPQPTSQPTAHSQPVITPAPSSLPTRQPFTNTPSTRPLPETVLPTKVPTMSPTISPTTASTNIPTAVPLTTTTTEAPITSEPTHVPTPIPWNVTTSAPVGTTVGAGNNNDNDSAPAVEIVLLGERHSGVDFFENVCRACYPGKKFSVYVTRETIWFQDPPRPDILTHTMPRQALVLVVRNVYDWLEAIRRDPIHMPAHREPDGESMADFEKFINLPWQPQGYTGPSPNDVVCQFQFKPNQVAPCLNHELTPPKDAAIYELDSDGHPFRDIIAMRDAKIHHFLEQVPVWWPNIVGNNTVVVRYEDGPDFSLLDSQTGWTHACPSDTKLVPDDASTTLKTYTSAELALVNQKVDWNVEQAVGYQPREVGNATNTATPNTAGNNETTPVSNSTNP